MIPQIIIIDKFPLLVNGKIDRQTLLAKYKDENYSSSTYYHYHHYFYVPETYKKLCK